MKFFVFRPESDGTYFFIVTDKDVHELKSPNLEEVTIQPFQPTLPGIVVAIEEEYGYRYWVWETGMEAEALKVFFLNLNPMDYFFHQMESLPGKIHQADLNAYGMTIYDHADSQNIEKIRFFSTDSVARAHFHTAEDTWIQIGDEYIEPLIKATLPPVEHGEG